MKRSKNTANVKNKRPKTSHRIFDEARFFYPKEIVHRLYDGKGGLIEKLRKQFDAIVNLSKYRDRNGLITIISSRENIINVISTLVWVYVTIKCEVTDATADQNANVQMLVNETALESIVKENHWQLRNMEIKNNASIIVHPINLFVSTDRVVQIFGSPSNCLNCIAELMRLINNSNYVCPVNRYDTFNGTLGLENYPKTNRTIEFAGRNVCDSYVGRDKLDNDDIGARKYEKDKCIRRGDVQTCNTILDSIEVDSNNDYNIIGDDDENDESIGLDFLQYSEVMLDLSIKMVNINGYYYNGQDDYDVRDESNIGMDDENAFVALDRNEEYNNNGCIEDGAIETTAGKRLISNENTICFDVEGGVTTDGSYCVPIPSYAVGIIDSDDGKTIARICSMSKVTKVAIVISNSNVACLVINGTREQIKYALDLIRGLVVLFD